MLVPRECTHYADFGVIYARMGRQRVPGPLLQARKKAWVQGYPLASNFQTREHGQYANSSLDQNDTKMISEITF